MKIISREITIGKNMKEVLITYKHDDINYSVKFYIEDYGGGDIVTDQTLFIIKNRLVQYFEEKGKPE